MSCGHNRASIKVGNFSYLSSQPIRNWLLYKTVGNKLKKSQMNQNLEQIFELESAEKYNEAYSEYRNLISLNFEADYAISG